MAEPTEDGCLTLDCYRPLIDRHTKAVSASWVSYGNGYRQDVPSLAALCHDSGAKLVIDAIQAVGILSDPISSLGADIVIAGGHKAQFSLTGAGFMYVNPDIISEITPPYAAKYSFTSNDRFQESPKLAGIAIDLSTVIRIISVFGCSAVLLNMLNRSVWKTSRPVFVK